MTRPTGPPRAPARAARPLGERLVEAASAALDLVVPQECAGCGRPGLSWCPACERQCRDDPIMVPGALPCRAAALHSGPAGRAVVAFKEEAARRLAGPLGALLATAVAGVLADLGAPPGEPVWLVPIPTRRAARRVRGADHTATLAARAARDLRARGVPANRAAVLVHVRASVDQVGLSRAQRAANVAGTLAARPLPPGTVVLVDDVTTTGATLVEAARSLRAVGADRLGAATVTWAGPGRHLASGPGRD